MSSQNESLSVAVGDPMDLATDMVCLCQHGTDGPNCETCLQDHWDVRWGRATSQSANECKRK